MTFHTERKCLPLLLFALEVCPLTKTDLRSLGFVVSRYFIKLFKTTDLYIVEICQQSFIIFLPSDILHSSGK